MNKKDIKDYFFKETMGILDKDEQDEVFIRIIESLYSMSRLEWLTTDITEIVDEDWNNIISRLKENEPIQYILGYSYFRNSKYMVSSDVLIPRPETEELVEWILSDNAHHTHRNIWDIGTGSGCIAIELKKHFIHSCIWATDISLKALVVADRNARLHDVDILLKQDDIFNSKMQNDPIGMDIIVSNPPYILPQEELDIRVRDYEPALALFVQNNDPLQFYKQIFLLAEKKLNKGGAVYFETHSEHHNELTKWLKGQTGIIIDKKQDFWGKNRFIRVKKMN